MTDTQTQRTPLDLMCEHGMAMDVHCCGCHSGFLFDVESCTCLMSDEPDVIGDVLDTMRAERDEARTERDAALATVEDWKKRAEFAEKESVERFEMLRESRLRREQAQAEAGALRAALLWEVARRRT